MGSTSLLSDRTTSWLAEYKAANADLLKAKPEFAAWLDAEYVPIAGGWQY